MSDTTVEIRELVRKLDAMRKQAKDLRPLWREIRPFFGFDLKTHFDQRRGPDTGWAHLARSTIEKRMGQKGVLRVGAKKRGLKRFTKKGRRRIVNMLGRLKGAWRFAIASLHIEARVSRPKWAGIHQHGGTGYRGITIPARPFMWASEGLLAQAVVKIRKFVAGGFK